MNAPGWTIRTAEAGDEVAIQALFAHTLLSARWLPDSAKDDVDFKRNSGGETVWVCVDGQGRLLGMVSVYAPGKFIHHLYVAPGQARRGVGRALLDSLDTWLPRPWYLKCVERNIEARAFYKACGWIETETNLGSQGRYVVLRRRADTPA